MARSTQQVRVALLSTALMLVVATACFAEPAAGAASSGISHGGRKLKQDLYTLGVDDGLSNARANQRNIYSGLLTAAEIALGQAGGECCGACCTLEWWPVR